MLLMMMMNIEANEDVEEEEFIPILWFILTLFTIYIYLACTMQQASLKKKCQHKSILKCTFYVVLIYYPIPVLCLVL